MCNHIEMSQDNELLPGIVAHLWCGRESGYDIFLKDSRMTTVYRQPQCWNCNRNIAVMLSKAGFILSTAV